MILLAAIVFIVVACDQLSKLQLRRIAESTNRSTTLKVVTRNLWLHRIGFSHSLWMVWIAWGLAAASLVAACAVGLANPVMTALLLGGSLSNLLDATFRGGVIDYVFVRMGLAANLADATLFVGAIGFAADAAMRYIAGL